MRLSIVLRIRVLELFDFLADREKVILELFYYLVGFFLQVLAHDVLRSVGMGYPDLRGGYTIY